MTIIRTGTKEVIHKNSFVTDFIIDRINVQQIAEAGRTRWKVENENNNVLKTKGYHLEHNYGHGDKHDIDERVPEYQELFMPVR